jgi:hypothetical protein
LACCRISDENHREWYGGGGKVKKFSGLQMEISKSYSPSKWVKTGLALARNASSWYSSSVPVKIVSPFLPSTSI